MYKSTGDLFMGNFNKGKAQGKGAYVMKDGSYYLGEFQENKAEG